MHKVEKSIPKEIEWAEKLVHLMDDQFKIPFINFRFGLDPIIGLVPWVGDVVSFIISALIIKALAREKLPTPVIRKMIFNVIIDLVVGSLPIAGDIWDFFYKANKINLTLAKTYYQSADYRGK